MDALGDLNVVSFDGEAANEERCLDLSGEETNSAMSLILKMDQRHYIKEVAINVASGEKQTSSLILFFEFSQLRFFVE